MEWTRGPAVGRGSSATVYLATAASSGHHFAVKSTDLSSSAFLQKEHTILSNLSSPFVIKCFGFEIETEPFKPAVFNLFMEYLPESLWDAIQSHGGRMGESMIGAYTRQILKGLEYLHANQLAHCDIKSRNLLIGENGIKIADLGCAKFVDRVAGNEDGEFSGTPAFMAPEVARGEEQGFAADVWAVGCTVIEMATGDRPWPEMDDPVSALYRIGFSGESPEVPWWLSERARDFVAKCLIKDPKERWTAKELLEHPFLQEFDPESQIESSRKKTMDLGSSPSCVLDQSFWDSMEDSGTPLKLADQASWSDPPAERIRRLSGNLSDWDWECDDRDWVMVRNNGGGGGSHGNGSVSSDFCGIIEEEELAEGEILNLEEDFELFLYLGEDDFISGVNSRIGGLKMEFESDFVLEIMKFGGPNEYCSSSLIQIDLFLFHHLLQNLISLFMNYGLDFIFFESKFQIKIYNGHNRNHQVTKFSLSNI